MGRFTMTLALLASLTFTSGAAAAPSPSAGENGQIVFSRVVSSGSGDDTVTYVVNSDGSGLRQLFPGVSGFPRWSPDGTKVDLLSCLDPPVCRTAAVIVDVATGDYRGLTMPDPNLFTACTAWSPDSSRLACESYGDSDPSLNGIYSIRTSDGRGLQRITSNPGGSDIPGDYSPSGGRLVFSRMDPSRAAGANVALFVSRTDGSALHRITPWGLPWAEDGGRWSPDGRSILFDDTHSLYVVHPDGSGLKRIRLTSDVVQLQNPDWSPDGTSIVFSASMATEGPGLFITNIDGTQMRRLTASSTYDRYGDWGTHAP